MSNWSVQKKVAIVAVAGAPLIFCLYNYYGERHFFGTYDLTALVICTAAVFILVKSFGPEFYKNDEGSGEQEKDNVHEQ